MPYQASCIEQVFCLADSCFHNFPAQLCEIELRMLFTFETADSKKLKVETTMLVSMNDFVIISFQKKKQLNIKWDMINALCNP